VGAKKAIIKIWCSTRLISLYPFNWQGEGNLQAFLFLLDIHHHVAAVHLDDGAAEEEGWVIWIIVKK
jgi:hypothetical protein